MSSATCGSEIVDVCPSSQAYDHVHNEAQRSVQPLRATYVHRVCLEPLMTPCTRQPTQFTACGRPVLLALVLLTTTANAASAGILTTPMLFDEGAHHVNCEISNVGTETVTIVEAGLHDYGGNQRVSYSACGGTVAPGASCGWGTLLPHPGGFGVGTRCHLEIVGSVDHVRTLMQTRNMDGSVRTASEGSADRTVPMASTLQSALLTDSGAHHVNCQLSNVGSATATILATSLRDYGGNERIGSSTCGATLDPGDTCGWDASLPHSGGFGNGTRCEVTVAGTVAALRSNMLTRNADGSIRQVAPMRPPWAPGTSILASGFIDDNMADHVVCELSNGGDDTVDIVSTSLRDHGGNQRIGGSSCGATLEPGDTCSWGADLPHSGGFGHGTRCEVEVAGDVSDVRAAIAARNADQSVRQLLEVHPSWRSPLTSQLQTGMLFDDGAAQVLCMVSNVGTQVVSFDEATVRDYGGNPRVGFSSCGATLGAGDTCFWGANLPHSGGFGVGSRCQFEAAGNIDDVRMTMETRNPDVSIRTMVEATPRLPVHVDDFEDGTLDGWSLVSP